MRRFSVVVFVALCACGGGESADAGLDGPRTDLGGADAPGADMVVCSTDDDSDGHISAACGGDDCNDADPNAYPGNTEVCDDAGHDDDCDPLTLGPDGDGDGASASGCCNIQVGGALICGGDCDDTRMTIGPSAIEACNAADDDCDGVPDDGVMMLTCFVDADGDTYAAVGATSRTACSCMAGIETTRAPVGSEVDCNDHNVAARPGATEVCDGIDNDCNGLIDDDTGVPYYPDCDGDTVGSSTIASPITACATPPIAPTACTGGGGWSTLNTDCDDGVSAVHPGAIESCNGRDDDCDMVMDPGCACVSGTSRPCGITVGRCREGTQSCTAAGMWETSCGGAYVGPTTETCNGVDDDCNGSVDDGLTAPTVAGLPAGRCYSGPAGTVGIGTCHAGDYVCNGAAGWGCMGEMGPSSAPECGTDTSCDGNRFTGAICIPGSPLPDLNVCGVPCAQTCNASCTGPMPTCTLATTTWVFRGGPGLFHSGCGVPCYTDLWCNYDFEVGCYAGFGPNAGFPPGDYQAQWLLSGSASSARYALDIYDNAGSRALPSSAWVVDAPTTAAPRPADSMYPSGLGFHNDGCASGNTWQFRAFWQGGASSATLQEVRVTRSNASYP